MKGFLCDWATWRHFRHKILRRHMTRYETYHDMATYSTDDNIKFWKRMNLVLEAYANVGSGKVNVLNLISWVPMINMGAYCSLVHVEVTSIQTIQDHNKVIILWLRNGSPPCNAWDKKYIFFLWGSWLCLPTSSLFMTLNCMLGEQLLSKGRKGNTGLYSDQWPIKWHDFSMDLVQGFLQARSTILS